MDTRLNAVKKQLTSVIKGSDANIDLLLICVLAGGHILLEDMPGVGKTTLAKALSACLSLKYTRISFTPDLLPTDLLGMNILNPTTGNLRFHEGPVFTNILLSDEINRASPRTQSALLECMNEGQVSIDNATMTLTPPFFVIATQNPIEQQGTYPLPEAQLDRFLMRISLGYPSLESELAIVYDRQTADPLDAVQAVLSKDDLLAAQKEVEQITVKEDVAKYLLTLINKTRHVPQFTTGASPRASLNLFRACQAKAYYENRSFVTPQDVQDLLLPVIHHRVSLTTAAKYSGDATANLLEDIIASERVPL